MDIKATGRFIAALRKEKGYTQKDLAQKLMVTDKAISRWETGKGLPDSALLKPLAECLGVSVGELLSGRRIKEEDMKEQTDNVILDSLNYSRRMSLPALHILLLIAGLALAVSPLFTAGLNNIWPLGVIAAGAAGFGLYLRQKRISAKAFYLAALAAQGLALILEILPFGAVMIFAAGPDERITRTFSYFSLIPPGYANVTPLLTGILTAASVALGLIAFLRFDKAMKLRNALFVTGLIALVFSVVPLFLFGPAGMAWASWAVSGLILLSVCLQAAANRHG